MKEASPEETSLTEIEEKHAQSVQDKIAMLKKYRGRASQADADVASLER
jgi:hypothetical protein